MEIILPIIEKLSSSFLSVTVLGPNYFGFVQIHATVNTNLMNLVIHLNELFGNSTLIDIVYSYSCFIVWYFHFEGVVALALFGVLSFYVK